MTEVSTVRRVEYDPRMVRADDTVAVFLEDLPGAKVDEVVHAFAGDECRVARVIKVNSFAIQIQLAAQLDAGAAKLTHEPRSVQYAQTVGGYVLIDPDTKARLCTPHPLMGDVAKIATQKGWRIISKGEE